MARPLVRSIRRGIQGAGFGEETPSRRACPLHVDDDDLAYARLVSP